MTLICVEAVLSLNLGALDIRVGVGYVVMIQLSGSFEQLKRDLHRWGLLSLYVIFRCNAFREYVFCRCVIFWWFSHLPIVMRARARCFFRLVSSYDCARLGSRELVKDLGS